MFVFRGLESGYGHKQFLVRVFILRRWRAAYAEKPNSESAMTFGIAFFVCFTSVLTFQPPRLSRKSCESLLREHERFRSHSHRSLKGSVNFCDRNQHERQR